MASQITSLTIVFSTVYSGADQIKHQSSVSLAFVRGIHRWPVNSPHKEPVTRKMFPFDDVIMKTAISWLPGYENTVRFKQYDEIHIDWKLENISIHVDVMILKRFPHNWPFVNRKHLPVTGGFASQRASVCGALVFYFLLGKTNLWTNNRFYQWFETPSIFMTTIISARGNMPHDTRGAAFARKIS